MATIKVQQVKGHNPFSKEDMYYVQAKQVGTMSANDLVENIVREGHVPRIYAEGVLKYLTTAVFDYMKVGMAVQIPGFGTLKLNIKSKAQPTRKQATCDTITSAKIQLIPLGEVKRELDNFHYELDETYDDEAEVQ